jgi:hypothetical protein
MMALMQMDYPGLTKPYFISNFIAGLRDAIKHYLIPHNPHNLCEAYWNAKELEKGILLKKSLLTTSPSYTTPPPPSSASQHPCKTQPTLTSQPTNKTTASQPNQPTTS